MWQVIVYEQGTNRIYTTHWRSSAISARETAETYRRIGCTVTIDAPKNGH